MPSNAPADSDQKPLPLTDSSFVHLIFPFSFHEAPEGTQRASDAFAQITQSIRDTTVGEIGAADDDSGQACWRGYDGDDPDYFLSHVQDFLFRGRLQATSGDGETTSEYTVSAELDNDARQSAFPTRMGDIRYLAERGRKHYNFPLQITNTRLYLFRSRVGLMVHTLEPGAEVTVLETSALDPIDDIEEELYWRKEILKNRSGDDSTGSESTTHTLTLDDLSLLNYQISRHPSEDKTPNREDTVPSGFYFKKRVRRDQDLFTGDADAPEWAPQYVDTFRRFDLERFSRNLLTASLGHPVGTRSKETTSKTGVSWRPFHEHRFLTYVFGLIDSGRMDEACSYDRIRRHLYQLRRSFSEKYKPTAAQLRDTENPEVLRTFENIAFGFSTEGGAVLAWPDDENQTFITENLSARIRRNYFFLCVLALHQHYACMHLARRIGNLGYEEGRSSSSETINAARDLREHIFAFLVQSWFHDVSDRRIYNQVYKRWQGVLDIRRHFGEVKSQVGEVDDYLQRIKNDREQRFADLISWVVVPIILFLNAVSVNFVEMQNISVTNRQVWIGTAVATALYFAIALGLRRYIR